MKKNLIILLASFFLASLGVFAAIHQADKYSSKTEQGDALQTDSVGNKSIFRLRTVPGEVLVRFKAGLSQQSVDKALNAVKARKIKAFKSVNNLHHVVLADGVSVQKAIKEYKKHAELLYVEPNFILEALALPNDARFTEQWGLNNTGQTAGTVDADIDNVEAWDYTVGDRNTVVAVIDTGIDYSHEDLSDNMYHNPLDCNADGVDDDLNGYVDDCYGIDTANNDSDPMDDNSHGSHVAGTIGATGNNNIGVSGVSWQTSLLACKFLDATGSGSTSGAIECLDYLAILKDQGVNIVASNNSWGGGLYSQAMADAIDAQQQRGILFITSAGNIKVSNDIYQALPCSYYLSNIICVAATDHNDNLASFSSTGSRTVHLSAPGVDTLSTIPDNGYALKSGSSMAAPHVTGVAALLAAQDSNRDWRTIKNLIIASGDNKENLASTISSRRLNAYGALNCTNSTVMSRLLPFQNDLTAAVGSNITLSMLHINCGLAYGSLTVTIQPGNTVIELLDDGLNSDQVAGDGIYTGNLTITGTDDYLVSFPDNTSLNITVDPNLKAGFPVKTYHGSGSYHGGPALHTLVGNIDADPELEIIVTGLATGPLFAWNSDGTSVTGWPIYDLRGAAYPMLGEFSIDDPGLEVFSGHFGTAVGMAAYSSNGLALPGWPKNVSNYVSTPPAAADVDGDGLDEIFIGEENWKLDAYKADGSVLSGWLPGDTLSIGSQERHTPAIVDLDGDGDLEILSVTGTGNSIAYLVANHHDGTIVSGFPVSFLADVDTFPVVGDVDADGQLEIILQARSSTFVDSVFIFSTNGTLERSMDVTGGIPYGSAPALADLDDDGFPEIILQSEVMLHAWKGNGNNVAGFPVAIASGFLLWSENNAPVVGDVDGDWLPEIVVTTSNASGNVGYLSIYENDGSLKPGFPREMPTLGGGSVPAIADIDLDGNNDIIVTGSFWNGKSGYYDKVWAFNTTGDNHGEIQWGQFMGNASHQGVFRRDPAFANITKLTVGIDGNGAGTVSSQPAGIQCGSDCSEVFARGATVILTATTSGKNIFTGWSGACAGQANPCTVDMTTSKIVTAVFEPLNTLTVTKSGGGLGDVISTPAGINCGTDCIEDYLKGISVSLTVNAAPGYIFTGWSGACSGQSTTCDVTMDDNHTVNANFEPLVTVNLDFTGKGSGIVISQPVGISCRANCQADFALKSTVQLTVTPDAGSNFRGWRGDCARQGNPCTLIMDNDKSVTVAIR